MPILGVCLVKRHDIPDHAGILAVLRNYGQGFLENALHIPVLKGGADAGRYKHTAVDAVFIPAHAGCDFGIIRGLPVVPREHQTPGINENLSADLLRHHNSVLPCGTGLGGLNAAGQILIQGVLCGNAVAAPPEEAVAIGYIVEDGAAHLLRC